MSWRLQLLQKAVSARKRSSTYRFQEQVTVVKPIDMIYSFWEQIGLERVLWPSAENVLEAWIAGLARFVAPVSETVRMGVENEMWNNPEIWGIAAVWAQSTPFT